MIDIHSHILYGLDDGARTFEESVEMIQLAYNSGTTKIVATSHYIPDTYPYSKREYEDRLNQLNDWIRRNELKFQILQGNELYLTREGITALISKNCRSINNGRYVLTELSDFMSLSKVEELLDLILQNGFVPVIAHIERLQSVSDDFSILDHWQSKGFVFQINGDSIINKKYKLNHSIAKRMLKLGYVHIVASDGHRKDRRMPVLKDSYDYVCKKYGESYANQIYTLNPERIINDQMIDFGDNMSKRNRFGFKRN